MSWFDLFKPNPKTEESPMELEIQAGQANAGAAVSAQPDPLLGVAATGNGAALGGGIASVPMSVSTQPVTAQSQASQLTVDTAKLKALLITLGHDVEAEWDHLIALASKAL